MVVDPGGNIFPWLYQWQLNKRFESVVKGVRKLCVCLVFFE
jgi:hypothetical protein